MIDFITAERVHFPVAMLCRTLGVARSGYYARLEHGLSRRQQEDQRLRVHIRAIHAESHGTGEPPASRPRCDLRARDPHSHNGR